jgi:hypothetical protein
MIRQTLLKNLQLLSKYNGGKLLETVEMSLDK